MNILLIISVLLKSSLIYSEAVLYHAEIKFPDCDKMMLGKEATKKLSDSQVNLNTAQTPATITVKDKTTARVTNNVPTSTKSSTVATTPQTSSTPVSTTTKITMTSTVKSVTSSTPAPTKTNITAASTVRPVSSSASSTPASTTTKITAASTVKPVSSSASSTPASTTTKITMTSTVKSVTSSTPAPTTTNITAASTVIPVTSSASSTLASTTTKITAASTVKPVASSSSSHTSAGSASAGAVSGETKKNFQFELVSVDKSPLCINKTAVYKLGISKAVHFKSLTLKSDVRSISKDIVCKVHQNSELFLKFGEKFMNLVYLNDKNETQILIKESTSDCLNPYRSSDEIIKSGYIFSKDLVCVKKTYVEKFISEDKEETKSYEVVGDDVCFFKYKMPSSIEFKAVLSGQEYQVTINHSNTAKIAASVSVVAVLVICGIAAFILMWK